MQFFFSRKPKTTNNNNTCQVSTISWYCAFGVGGNMDSVFIYLFLIYIKRMEDMDPKCEKNKTTKRGEPRVT